MQASVMVHFDRLDQDDTQSAFEPDIAVKSLQPPYSTSPYVSLTFGPGNTLTVFLTVARTFTLRDVLMKACAEMDAAKGETIDTRRDTELRD